MVNSTGHGPKCRCLFDIILQKSQILSDIVFLERFDGLDVEALKSIRLEVGGNEDGQIVEAVHQIQDRIARNLMNGTIVPDVCIQPE